MNIKSGLRLLTVLVLASGSAAAEPVVFPGSMVSLPSSDSAVIPKVVTITGSTDVLFPSTPTGSTSTFTCASFCVYDPSKGPRVCGDIAGPIALSTAATSPFRAFNFQVVNVASDSCTGTPVTLPTTLGIGQALVFDLSFTPLESGDTTGSMVLTTNLGGFEYNFLGTTLPTHCVQSDSTVCLSYGRFAVSAQFVASGGSPSGAAHMEKLSDDTGNMWFFSPSNIEAEVKVINGCGLNNHYWVFAGGLTNVRVVMTVTDTVSGVSKTYTNKQGTAFTPIQDTNAFAQCP